MCMVYGHFEFGILNDKVDSCATNKHRDKGGQRQREGGKKERKNNMIERKCQPFF